MRSLIDGGGAEKEGAVVVVVWLLLFADCVIMLEFVEVALRDDNELSAGAGDSPAL